MFGWMLFGSPYALLVILMGVVWFRRDRFSAAVGVVSGPDRNDKKRHNERVPTIPFFAVTR